MMNTPKKKRGRVRHGVFDDERLLKSASPAAAAAVGAPMKAPSKKQAVYPSQVILGDPMNAPSKRQAIIDPSQVIDLLDDDGDGDMDKKQKSKVSFGHYGDDNNNNNDEVIVVMDASSSTRLKRTTTTTAIPFVPTFTKPVYKYDYSSTSPSLFSITVAYTQHALSQLYQDFPWLHQRFLTLILPTFHGRYSYLYDMILSCFTVQEQQTQPFAAAAAASVGNNQEEDEFVAFKSMKQFLYPQSSLKTKKFIPPNPFLKNFQQRILIKLQKPTSISWLLSSPRLTYTTNAACTSVAAIPLSSSEDLCILHEEKQFIQNKWQQWQCRIEQQIHLQSLRQEAIQQGTAVECSCCFTSVAFEEMISCIQEGHLFCFQCIQRYVEERVFGLGSFTQQGGKKNNTTTSSVGMDITCMHSDGCTSTFPYLQLERCLPPKVLEKYNELQCHVVLEKAGLHNLGKCPKCGFQALVNEEQKNFFCPIPTCQFKSCRQCGEAGHDPIPCDKVEKTNETAARLKVEEAMSEARIRTCPKCARKFYKQDGCNKMTCSCGTKICYICRQVITGYQHFCQIPHCQHNDCKHCPLHSGADEKVEIAAIREAGLKVVAAIEKSDDNRNQPVAWKTTVDDLLKAK